MREVDSSYGYLKRFVGCFMDYRDPELIEHSVLELVRQRVYGIAAGYEDLNDHDWLRLDPFFSVMCGKEDVLGQKRNRAEDRGKALAGKSTLNRMELTPSDADSRSRYKKVVAGEKVYRIEDHPARGQWILSG